VQGLIIFGISVSIVAAIITISGSYSSTNIPFLLVLGSLGVILSEIFRKNYSIETTIILPVMAIVILWFSFILLYSLFHVILAVSFIQVKAAFLLHVALSSLFMFPFL
jgi:hypothetical protein